MSLQHALSQSKVIGPCGALTWIVAVALLGCSSCKARDIHGSVEGFTYLAPSQFVSGDPAAWEVYDEAGRLDLIGKSAYKPPHRSPTALAILKGQEFGSFEFEVEARSTGRQYGHRDLCLVFGYQDPGHFYYIHLAPAPDPHAHNIFLVDGSARRALLPIPNSGMDWDDDWHCLRLVRDATRGAVAVYVDAGQQPMLEVIDSRFLTGAIGLGSFDDSGEFRGMRLRVDG